jgi:hypothetical protein
MKRNGNVQEGYVLLEKIRKYRTPFFIYSSSNAPEHKKMALENGAQGATNNPQELYQMVRNKTLVV